MLDLHAATFRASPSYELVVSDRLAPEEREQLSTLDPDPDLYGLLRPRGEVELEPRAVTQDTALLFLTLQAPGRLPAYVSAGETVDAAIATLVLDGVLEVEHGQQFVSGAEAHDLLLAAADTSASGRTIALSHAALRYGQALEGLPAEVLALRLYHFGRLPLTAALRRRLPTEDAVSGALGLISGGRARARLGRAWVEDPPGEQSGPWRMVRHRAAGVGAERAEGAKLYVSPRPEHAGDAVAVVAEVLAARAGVVGFKVARDAGGLCRPDKLVCYFSRLDDLRAAVSELQPRLEGLAAQGVPFTAPIDAGGLLSWGLDPPLDATVAKAGAGESWRLRVARLAAELLVAARGTRSATREPWQLALDRLRLAGIDPETWVPSARVWVS